MIEENQKRLERNIKIGVLKLTQAKNILKKYEKVISEDDMFEIMDRILSAKGKFGAVRRILEISFLLGPKYN